MNKFLICGDSYADEYKPPHPSVEENDEWQKTHLYRWPIKIKKEFEKKYFYENLALSGSSPYDAILKLQLRYDELKENDIILFFLSDFDRIDFYAPEEIKTHVSNIFYSSITKKSSLFDDPSFKHHNKLKAFYLLNETEIDFFYNNFFKIFSIELLEKLFLGYLKNISYEKKCRMIVFSKNDFIKKYENTDYFYLYTKNLSEVSDDEWKNKKQAEQEYMIKDDRVNHISPENHSVMYETIKKIIEYNNCLPEFKKNIIDEPLNLVYTEKNDRKFIYE